MVRSVDKDRYRVAVSPVGKVRAGDRFISLRDDLTAALSITSGGGPRVEDQTLNKNGKRSLYNAIISSFSDASLEFFKAK
jgi:hypothetical protein